MLVNGYVSKVWQEIFTYNGLADFERIWASAAAEAFVKDINTFPKERKLELNLPNGGKTSVIVKIEKNEVPNKVGRLFKPESSLLQEQENIYLLKKNHLLTPEPVYYEERTDESARSILITCELTYFQSVKVLGIHWELLPPPIWLRIQVIQALAKFVHTLHAQKLFHKELTCEMIHVRYARTKNELKRSSHIAVAFFDVKNIAQCRFRSRKHALENLITLCGSCQHWSRADLLRFYLNYRSHSRLTLVDKLQIRRILRGVNKIRIKNQEQGFFPRSIMTPTG